MGSADLMPRNLNRRVEQLFPVDDPALKTALHDKILTVHLQDNVQSRRLLPDGNYERLKPEAGRPRLNSQLWMIEHRGEWHTQAEENTV